MKSEYYIYLVEELISYKLYLIHLSKNELNIKWIRIIFIIFIINLIKKSSITHINQFQLLEYEQY